MRCTVLIFSWTLASVGWSQLISTFDFVGSTNTDWSSAVSQPFSVNTSSPGSIASDYDNFLIYSSLPAPFSSYTFAPGDTMVLRGDFRLLPNAAIGQSFLANASGFYGFGFSLTNDSLGNDLIRVWTFDGLSTTIYDDHLPGFSWNKDSLNRTEINYVITATRTPTGIIMTGDIYNGSILKHSFNETLTFTPPSQPSYSMETLLIASTFPFGGPVLPVADNITFLEWEIQSPIPEPHAVGVLLAATLAVTLLLRRRIIAQA